jgi:hypothetical protein
MAIANEGFNPRAVYTLVRRLQVQLIQKPQRGPGLVTRVERNAQGTHVQQLFADARNPFLAEILQ